MLQVLKDIAGNRMPAVADLLKAAAQAPDSPAPATALASAVDPSGKTKTGPRAGTSRAAGAGGPPAAKKDAADRPPVPTVSDVESSQNAPPKDAAAGAPPPPSAGPAPAPRLGLAETTVIGNP